jgi:hypothetical protein
MALTVSARARFRGPSTPALIRGAGLCAALGIGLSLTDYADYGKWLSVLGVVLLIVGLHRFGRTGPDAAIVFELAPVRKKKKKKKAALAPSEGEPSASAESSEPNGQHDDEAERGDER